MIMMILPMFLACGLMDVFESSSSRIDEAAKIGEEAKKMADVVEEEKEEEIEYSYNPNNKRDPFQSFLSFSAESSLLDNVPRTPLQKYEVGQYILTGVIWGIDRPRALVEDPEGIGHVVEIGTYVGTKWGKVEAIEEGIVVVTEERQTVDGQLVVKRLELRLDVNNEGGL